METLPRKAQLQEVELERTSKQLKEAISIAGEETAKCKAAKEVIKSLTSQVSYIHSYHSTFKLCQSCAYVGKNIVLLFIISTEKVRCFDFNE